MKLRVTIGPPGTGKTTHLVETIRRDLDRLRKPLVSSLTKSAAQEIRSRVGNQLPPQQVGTLHSLGYQAIGCPDLVYSHLADWNAVALPEWALTGKQDKDDPYAETGTKLPGDLMLDAYGLFRARKQPIPPWLHDFAEAWDKFKRETDSIDFTDQIERAIGTKPPFGADTLLVDEAQDNSALELDLLRSWAEQMDVLEIVGDPWQALYVWRGAHPDMFAGTTGERRILSQSYRVPRAVHSLATGFIRQHLSNWSPIGYKPTDEAGEVTSTKFHWRQPECIVSIAQRYVDAGQTVMVLGACNYMLTPIARELRSQALPFANPWRTKRGDWNPLGKSTKDRTSMSDRVRSLLAPVDVAAFDFSDTKLPWTWQQAHRWLSVIKITGVLNRNCKSLIKENAVRVDLQHAPVSLSMFTDEARYLLLRAVSIGDHDTLLRWWAERAVVAAKRSVDYVSRVVLSHGLGAIDEAPRLFIGTIHSFKGAEADVVIMFPDLSYNGFCGWKSKGEDHDGVVRMFYVGMTRARHKLIVCYPEQRDRFMDGIDYAKIA